MNTAPKLVGDFFHNPISDFQFDSVHKSQQSARALSFCKQATELYQQGALIESLERLIQATSLSREIGGVYYAMGVTFARLGKFEDAVKVLNEELRNQNPHPKTRELFVDIRSKIGGATEVSAVSRQLTIFTVPKAFEGHTAVIQRNAIRSWIKLTPQPEIILVGDEDGVAETALELGLIHLPDVEKSDQGTPLVSSIFQQGQAHASSDIVAYVNTDIILMDDFSKALQTLGDEASLPFLAVGRRWDIDLWNELTFADGWEFQLKEVVEKSGLLHRSTGIDYFIFPKGLYSDVLPFTVGRTVWDNWLLWYALSRGARLIDATPAITVIHQEHTYTHRSGGVVEVWRGEEARRNQALAGENLRTIKDAAFTIDGGVIPIKPRHKLPEPSDQDCIDFKYRQAQKADLYGNVNQAWDHLTYIEMTLGNCTIPRGHFFLKAKLLTKLVDLNQACGFAERELVAYPDNQEATAIKAALTQLLSLTTLA